MTTEAVTCGHTETFRPHKRVIPAYHVSRAANLPYAEVAASTAHVFT